MRRVIHTLFSCLALAAPAFADADRPVVVEGLVPDDATRAEIMRKLRQTYPDLAVVDKMQVGNATAPANWSRYVAQAIGPNLRQVSSGELAITGNAVKLGGTVRDDAIKQAVGENLTSAFNGTYRISTDLKVDDASSRQGVLDRTLADRTVQFESGSAVLTPDGVAVLNQMATAITQIGTPALDIIGHTDGAGDRQANILLSMARADAVKAYLGGKGIAPATMVVSGRGPDQPIADNATPAGRARNRRIEFTIRQ